MPLTLALTRLLAFFVCLCVCMYVCSCVFVAFSPGICSQQHTVTHFLVLACESACVQQNILLFISFSFAVYFVCRSYFAFFIIDKICFISTYVAAVLLQL